MTYTRASAKFFGIDEGFELWQERPGDYDYRYVLANDKVAILSDLDRINSTSLGRDLLNKAISADSLRFVGFDDVGGLKASPAYALNATNGNTIEAVQINYTGTKSDLYWFNTKGTLVKADPALTIAHELAHIVFETRDPAGTDAEMNAAGFDFQGPQVRAQNVIARQLGTPD